MIGTFDWDQVASKREQLLLVGTLFGLILLTLQGVFVPNNRTLGSLTAERRALRLERDALSRFLEATPAVFSRRTESVGKRRWDSLQGGEFSFEDLTSPALLGPVLVNGFSFQPPTEEAGIAETSFQLQLSGRFRDLVGYLERLERFPALFVVEDLSLSAAEGPNGRIRAEVHGRFFSRRSKGARS